MPVVLVEAAAPVASWRPPEAMTYQPTLPLPPYTAQVGVLGAALGLGLSDAYRFVADRRLRLGVGGGHEGKARDLWKHQKLDGTAHKSDILLREWWIDTRLMFVIEVPDAATADQVAAAYAGPAYPLTAGTSDALMAVLSVRVIEAEPVPTRRLMHTLIYEEISPRYEMFEKIKDIPLTRTIRAPNVENLPTGFEFDGDGNRQRAGRARVSFIADPIELDPAVPAVAGYGVDPVSRRLRAFSARWGDLQWIIPVHRY